MARLSGASAFAFNSKEGSVLPGSGRNHAGGPAHPGLGPFPWTDTRWVSWRLRPADIKSSGIQLTIREFERDRFADVKRIFVDNLGGEFVNLNDLIREQVMASIVNSGRFELVDDRSKADAIIFGRAERRERGTAVQSSGQERTLNQESEKGQVFGVRAAGIAYGIGAAHGTATGLGTATEKLERSEVLFSDFLVLRLTTATGESIWAWDDTKPCEGSHPKCAVGDLLRASTIPTTEDGK